MITAADLVRWHAAIRLPEGCAALTPHELAALPVPAPDLVWVLAHAIAEACEGVNALAIVRDVARTSAAVAQQRAAPGEPGWREAVAAEDRRQIQQMIEIMEEKT